MVRRIFSLYCAGYSQPAIAKKLNADGLPSPRAGTRHKRFGWGPSTIRAILYNEKYAGHWKFKERQWVKIPGTNKRAPRPRNPDEVISQDRPDLRIIGPDVWQETQIHLANTKRKYTKQSRQVVAPRGRKSSYLLSGILVCDHCGAPLTIYGGSPSYYRCADSRNRGTCANRRPIREDVIRREILSAIREQLRSPEAIDYVRKRIAEELGGYSRKLETELKERKERLARTEERIRGLIGFIANGDRSQYIGETLRDLEAQAKDDKAAIARVQDELRQPVHLPSIEEISAMTFDLEKRMAEDPQAGRAQLQRWLSQAQIRVRANEDGSWTARGDLLPLVILNEKSRPEQMSKAALNNISSGGHLRMFNRLISLNFSACRPSRSIGS